MASKVTYVFRDGYYVSSDRRRKRPIKVASLPRNYLKGADGVYRYVPPSQRNSKQPHKRVRKALRKYVDKSLGLPTQYTPAKVRVDSKGEIDIKFARPPKGKLKNPKRFKVNRKK
jgi:hypothetical protein